VADTFFASFAFCLAANSLPDLEGANRIGICLVSLGCGAENLSSVRLFEMEFLVFLTVSETLP
jgi:hypothetical protein